MCDQLHLENKVLHLFFTETIGIVSKKERKIHLQKTMFIELILEVSRNSCSKILQFIETLTSPEDMI